MSTDVVTGAFAPPVWSKTIWTGPTPYPHHVVRVPLPYGSPSAPSCVMVERISAASTGCWNAGTEIFWTPRYCDELVTSFCVPPVLVHAVPSNSGSASMGDAERRRELVA